jgi:hypothetical protein
VGRGGIAPTAGITEPEETRHGPENELHPPSKAESAAGRGVQLKISCPYCNETFDLEAYLKDSVMIQVIKMLPDFGPHGRLVWEYAELFRIGPPLNARKLYRVLAEVREMFVGQGFDFQKRRYEISREGIAQALRIVCYAHIKSPLAGQNYLKKVMIPIAEEEAGKKSREEEKKRRGEEEKLKLGDPQITQIQNLPGKVKDLLGRIGG